jgi:CMP-N,N'-diacetyllegionaminic acid synthase
MNLAIIPARGGSKGIPKKNLQVVGTASLLSRAVSVALRSNLYDEVFVSTDDPDIQQEAILSGASCPFLRSNYASSDAATTEAVVSEVLSSSYIQVKSYDSFSILEPSSPVRSRSILKYSLDLLHKSKSCDSSLAVSVVPPKYNFRKQLIVSSSSYTVAVDGSCDTLKSYPRQALQPAYIRNGVVYSCKVSSFISNFSVVGPCASMILCNFQAVNIDNPEDLEAARVLIGSLTELELEDMIQGRFSLLNS